MRELEQKIVQEPSQSCGTTTSTQSNKPSRRWNIDVTETSRKSTLAGACQTGAEPFERGSREVEGFKKSGRRVVEEYKKSARSHNWLRWAAVMAVMMAWMMPIKEAWGQVTITDDPDNPNIYLIQSYCNEAFYMRDNNRNNTPSKVNTSNIVTINSEWYFLDGGTYDNIQYYYIVHKNTTKYVYLSSDTEGNYAELKDAPASDASEDEKDHYRFKFEANDSRPGSYNIIVKLNSSTLSLNKEDGNSKLGNIRQYAVNNDNSCWKFVAKTAYQKAECPFDLSTVDDKYYYNIRNNDYQPLYMKPGASYVVGDNTFADENDRIWYFVKAAEDEYLDYYHIVHPKTGKYLRYRGNATTEVTSNAVELKEYNQNANQSEKNRFLYIIVPGSKINETHESTTLSSTYCIAPMMTMVLRVENTISLCTYSHTSGPSSINQPLKTFKERDNNNLTHWDFISATYNFNCNPPVIDYNEATNTVSISANAGATIYYTTDGSDPAVPTTGSTTITAPSNPYSFNPGESVSLIKAVAATNPAGSDVSEQAFLFIRYITVSSSEEIDNMNIGYSLADGFTSLAPIGTAEAPFKGIIEGNLVVLSGLDHPLVAYSDGATIKNVMLDNVTISGGTNVGAVCNEATGASRIYNCGILATGSTVETDEEGYTIITDCSSTISGSGFVGGIVGFLDGESRVINCFSYANIEGGNLVGGIVGKNNVATTSSNLKTMVMNCMFYGDITDGSSKAPIYNGTIITNAGDNGVSNFNYFWSGASYVQNKLINEYNCALAAETRFLQRFEFFRLLLNSNRELAAWWASTSSTFVTKSEMLKWVMIPDSIGTTTPYPILKTPGKYPSVVNFDAANAQEHQPRNKGGKLGTLSVTIQMDDASDATVPFHHPDDASLNTTSLSLPILDKDTAHFNFNYYKVQLPYYNDVGTKNYNGNRVVTGWKIVSITGGTPGTYTTGSDVTFTDGEPTSIPFNFADRNCTAKDLYSGNTANDHSGRVFNQGAYWDVPEGVTAITIEPYWAKAAYVADGFADVVYNTNMTTPQINVPYVGGGSIYTNNTNYPIAGENQKVYTSIGNAVTALAMSDATYGVNDYAVVLVGNYHQIDGINTKKPYTVTSIDLDHDNEPDYNIILRFNKRTAFHAVKYDFVSLIGLGMAQKSTGGKGTYSFGIPQPLGWFESTNTSLFRVTQFEFDRSDRAAQPIILQGGVMEQWVAGQSNGVSNNTIYYHVGGNVWFKEFHLGCHQDVLLQTKHPPVSVTGGDFNEFYLTGLYSNAPNFEDDAECYVNGGRFGTVAGTGMEGIGKASNHTKGNITWLIDNADIKEFFAGGINAAKIAEGDLYTQISNSYVDRFYGGPKFGDMNSGRTVKTTASNCTFGYFFGAGYGGNSYYTAAPGNFTNEAQDPWYSNDDKGYNLNWDRWVKGEIKSASVNHGNYKVGSGSSAYEIPYTGYHRDYIAEFGGVSTAIDYQFLPFSDNLYNVGRLFLKFVKFSLATTRSITSTLTGCTIENNFYGGGSLGKVEGNVESILDGCTVYGDVYGAGYSAQKPTVPVMDRGGFKKHEVGQSYPYYQPYYDKNLGAYLPGQFPSTVDYTWVYDPVNHNVTSTETAVDTIEHKLYTTVDLAPTNLGSVIGNVTLTIKGNSTVSGSVYGGGEESVVGASDNPSVITITLQDNTHVTGSVYGGGDEGEVMGEAAVTVKGKAEVGQNVFGGGNEAPVGQNTTVILQEGATVNGNVYGGGNNGPVGGNSEVRIQNPQNP